MNSYPPDQNQYNTRALYQNYQQNVANQPGTQRSGSNSSGMNPVNNRMMGGENLDDQQQPHSNYGPDLYPTVSVNTLQGGLRYPASFPQHGAGAMPMQAPPPSMSFPLSTPVQVPGFQDPSNDPMYGCQTIKLIRKVLKNPSCPTKGSFQMCKPFCGGRAICKPMSLMMTKCVKPKASKPPPFSPCRNSANSQCSGYASARPKVKCQYRALSQPRRAPCNNDEDECCEDVYVLCNDDCNNQDTRSNNYVMTNNPQELRTMRSNTNVTISNVTYSNGNTSQNNQPQQRISAVMERVQTSTSVPSRGPRASCHPSSIPIVARKSRTFQDTCVGSSTCDQGTVIENQDMGLMYGGYMGCYPGFAGYGGYGAYGVGYNGGYSGYGYPEDCFQGRSKSGDDCDPCDSCESFERWRQKCECKKKVKECMRQDNSTDPKPMDAATVSESKVKQVKSTNSIKSGKSKKTKKGKKGGKRNKKGKKK